MLHPNNVENVVSLFSSPSTSSQKVRKCGSHNFLSQAIYSITHTHVCPLYKPVSFWLPSSGACAESSKYPYVWYMYHVEQVEVLLSQLEWNSRDSPTETWLTDRYRSTDSLSFVTPANFPRTVTVRSMANDVTYTMYAALPIHLRVQSMGTCTI